MDNPVLGSTCLHDGAGCRLCATVPQRALPPLRDARRRQRIVAPLAPGQETKDGCIRDGTCMSLSKMSYGNGCDHGDVAVVVVDDDDDDADDADDDAAADDDDDDEDDDDDDDYGDDDGDADDGDDDNDDDVDEDGDYDDDDDAGQ